MNKHVVIVIGAGLAFGCNPKEPPTTNPPPDIIDHPEPPRNDKELPPNPPPASEQITPSQRVLPTWDDVKSTHPEGATNPPHMFIINKGQIAYMGAIDDKRSPNSDDIGGAKNYVAKALDEILAGQSVSEPDTKAYGCSVKYGN